MHKSYPIRKKETYVISSPEGVKSIDVYEPIGKEKDIELPDDIDPEILNHPSFSGNTIYEGTAQVFVHVAPGKVAPHPIQFDIEADSLDEAFDKFDDCAKEEADNFEKEIRERIAENQKQIITPQSGGILMP